MKNYMIRTRIKKTVKPVQIEAESSEDAIREMDAIFNKGFVHGDINASQLFVYDVSEILDKKDEE